MPARLRTFICLELSAALRQQLNTTSAELRAACPRAPVTWVPPEKMHLTLKFLGDTPENAVPRVRAVLHTLASATPKFSFAVSGLGCFPNFKQPRVVWAGLTNTSALGQLQKLVEAQIAPLGFPTEARSFAPHLTLGRVKPEAARAEVAALGEVIRLRALQNFGTESVAQIILMRSDLQRGGAIYTPLAKIDLC